MIWQRQTWENTWSALAPLRVALPRGCVVLPAPFLTPKADGSGAVVGFFLVFLWGDGEEHRRAVARTNDGSDGARL